MCEDLLHTMGDTAVLRAWRDKQWVSPHKRLLVLSQSLEQSGWKMHTGTNQLSLIMNHIKQNGSITQREAYIDYGIQSFSKRISELRSMGYPIMGVRRKHPVTKQDYTRYSIAI